MNEQLELIRTVSARLDENKIPYMITGSAALDFYAEPRMTRDIDLVVELETKDVPRLVGLFSPDFYIDAGAVADAVRRRSLFNAIHNKWMIKVDFIVRKDEEYRRLEFSRRKTMLLDDGMTVSVVSPEDLILSKLEWSKDSGSEMQLRDVRNLLSQVSNLDCDYLRQWAVRLGVQTRLNGLLR